MKRATAFVVSTAAVVSVATLVAANSGLAPSQPPQSAAPTFTKDVAPVLFKNCVGCHRPGGLGPMPLLTYDDAKSHLDEMRDEVGAGHMPPWHADPKYGTFANDRRLPDREKQTILRWISAGAPRGNPRDMPPVPTFPQGWSIGTPDAIVSMPTEYEVPAQGVIEYQYFEAQTGFTEDKWVQAIEILPGMRAVVHHVIVYAREPVPSTRPQVVRPRTDLGVQPPPPPPPQPGVQPRPRRTLGFIVATTAPGTNAMTFPAGSALRVAAGTVLTFQMHYTAHGEAMKDRSSVGFVFAKTPPEEEVRVSSFVNGRFVIPAGADNHQVDSQIAFSEDVHVWGILPHTHLRGKRWEYRLVKPDGTSEIILAVPKYDFNWQTYYVFAKPLAVPLGARIEASAWYDNSRTNSANPDPTVEVRWGDQTWEEMQYTGFLYTVDSQRRGGGTPPPR